MEQNSQSSQLKQEPSTQSEALNLEAQSKKEVSEIQSRMRVKMWRSVEIILTSFLYFVIYAVLAVLAYLLVQLGAYLMRDAITRNPIAQMANEVAEVAVVFVFLASGIVQAFYTVRIQLSPDLCNAIERGERNSQLL